MAQDTKFNLEDAKQLFDGTFYDDDPPSSTNDPNSLVENLFNAKQMLGQNGEFQLLKEFE